MKQKKENKGQDKPQFTESIAMILEQFKNPPKEPGITNKLKHFSKRLILISITLLVVLAVIWILTQVNSIELITSDNATRITINYK